jgi:hypothetical protein
LELLRLGNGRPHYEGGQYSENRERAVIYSSIFGQIHHGQTLAKKLVLSGDTRAVLRPGPLLGSSGRLPGEASGDPFDHRFDVTIAAANNKPSVAWLRFPVPHNNRPLRFNPAPCSRPSSALLRFIKPLVGAVDGELAVALRISVGYIATTSYTVADKGPREHFQVAIKITERRDGRL